MEHVKRCSMPDDSSNHLFSQWRLACDFSERGVTAFGDHARDSKGRNSLQDRRLIILFGRFISCGHQCEDHLG